MGSTIMQSEVIPVGISIAKLTQNTHYAVDYLKKSQFRSRISTLIQDFKMYIKSQQKSHMVSIPDYEYIRSTAGLRTFNFRI